MTAIKYSLLVSLVSNKLTNYGRRHFKQFTNCHVSWDTLYIEFDFKPCPSIVKNNWVFIRFFDTGDLDNKVPQGNINHVGK